MPAQSMVIDLVMVAPPKGPESRQLISPSGAVASWANEKLMHGAARVHGPPALPVDDTKVVSLCACAGAAGSNETSTAARLPESSAIFVMASPLVGWMEVTRLLWEGGAI